MNRDELRQEISNKQQQGDLNRCAHAFGHDYHYLNQVVNGHRNNDEMLEDMLYTIRQREVMETRLRTTASRKQQSKHHI